MANQLPQRKSFSASSGRDDRAFGVTAENYKEKALAFMQQRALDTDTPDHLGVTINKFKPGWEETVEWMAWKWYFKVKKINQSYMTVASKYMVPALRPEHFDAEYEPGYVPDGIPVKPISPERRAELAAVMRAVAAKVRIGRDRPFKQTPPQFLNVDDKPRGPLDLGRSPPDLSNLADFPNAERRT